jgi:hypothetical protein
MTKQLTLQDYQAISVYLDNAYSPKQKSDFENRLTKDPALQQALQEFAYTRRLLQAIPVRKAPRSFTLSASKVPSRPQRFFLAPALNFTAMAAALLLVVVFAGSHLLPGILGTQTSSESITPMTASAAEVAREVQNSPMIIIWGQSGNAYAGSAKNVLGGGGDVSTMNGNVLLGAGAPAPESTQPIATMVPDAFQTVISETAPISESTQPMTSATRPAPELIQPVPSGTAPMPEVTQPAIAETVPAAAETQSSTPEETLMPSETQAAPITTIAQAKNSSSMILGIPSTADQGKVISALPSMAQVSNPQPVVNITVIEIGLGALAILCLLISVFLRKLR